MHFELSGSITAFFLFDIGDAIDLARVRERVATVPAPLTLKSAPASIQYQQPPLSIAGMAVGVDEIDGFRVRLKAFDYGVLSVALVRPMPPTWEALLGEGLRWHENPALAASALGVCRALVDRVTPAIAGTRGELLLEDYLVFAMTPPGGREPASALVAAHGAEIAQLLRGEREALSVSERDEVFRHSISYLDTDLVVPTWNAAFVYDGEAGAQGAIEILEFANSQLLEFRYYDQLLDGELVRIYAQLQRHGWRQTLFGRRYTRAARHVHALFIDINELTDKTENALKIAGDVYAARLFGLAAARLGLEQWKQNVRDKLQTVDDIYRFAVEQTSMTRGEFLELVVVVILVIELILVVLGVMK